MNNHFNVKSLIHKINNTKSIGVVGWSELQMREVIWHVLMSSQSENMSQEYTKSSNTNFTSCFLHLIALDGGFQVYVPLQKTQTWCKSGCLPSNSKTFTVFSCGNDLEFYIEVTIRTLIDWTAEWSVCQNNQWISISNITSPLITLFLEFTVASWFLSPLLSGIMSGIVFYFVRMFILRKVSWPSNRRRYVYLRVSRDPSGVMPLDRFRYYENDIEEMLVREWE